MNGYVRKLLDDKKEENRLIAEGKLKPKKESIKEPNNTTKKIVKKETIKKTKKKVKKIVKKETINIPKQKVEKIVKIENKIENKIQSNYDELKKISERTERFIALANNIDIDNKDVPKTEKGMNSKAKELMKNLYKKLEKEDIKVKTKKKK